MEPWSFSLDTTGERQTKTLRAAKLDERSMAMTSPKRPGKFQELGRYIQTLTLFN